jgi:hypothetical protein
MRDRHFPRLCRSCEAPMAREEDSCWRCAAAWDYRSARQSPSVLVSGGHAARLADEGQPSAREDIRDVGVGARVAAVR